MVQSIFQVCDPTRRDSTTHVTRNRHPGHTDEDTESREREVITRSCGCLNVFRRTTPEVRAAIAQGTSSAQLGAIDPVEVHCRFGGRNYTPPKL